MGGPTSHQPKTVLIMAGGTGGHVFPALAVAEELIGRGCRVAWLGTRKGIEAQLVVKENIPINYIRVAGLRGKGLLAGLMAPVKLLIAVWQSLTVIRREQPACVLGMGGFAAGPGGVAAWLLRRPLVIHEQNAVAGMTNRLLRPLADTVLAAFPGAFGGSASTREQCVGNPVRRTITQLAAPEARLSERQGPLRLLVLGGSLGAAVLNERVPQALALLSAEQRPLVWHQTGRHHDQHTLDIYWQLGLEAQVEPFIEEMATAYEWADLIVCRAGALTISELACAGLAAILVPYPHAVDDHQSANAHYLEQAGAAVCIAQAEFTADRLAQLLSNDFAHRRQVLTMAQQARRLAITDAAAMVADYCMEASNGQ